MIGAFTNHLWQSTLFVLAAAMVAAALRQNGANVRHRIWFIASLKFLLPFAWLISLGSALPRFAADASNEIAPAPAVSPDLSVAVDRIAEPFTSDLFASAVSASQPTRDWALVAIVAIWACGFAAIVLTRWRGWRRVRAAVHASVRVPLVAPVPVRAAAGLLEPGVVGIWRQILLVPEGIERHLTPAQLHAVLEHEYCHVRRRDNLTSAVHMLVEAGFWFHPFVWWVGARMIDERERACDEQVLRVCGEPQTYAESILNVCKLYVESPLACVSGVTGAGLKTRIAAIIGNRVGVRLTMVRKLALALVAMLAVGSPLLAGIVVGSDQAGQAPATFEVVSIKPCSTNTPPPQRAAPSGGRAGGAPWDAQVSPGYAYWHCATLAQLIPQAYADQEQPLLNVSLRRQLGDAVQPAYIKGGPSWVSADKFTIEARGSIDMTSPALAGRANRTLVSLPPLMSRALRALLEDRFQLKVRRATEERDMYALTLAEGGLNKAKVTLPVPGDCMTAEEYFASPAASAPLEERMKNAGKYRICGQSTTGIFASFTFSQLAAYLASGGLLNDVVVNRTGVETPVNFEWVLADRSEGTVDERVARALAPLGLKLKRVKAPAEYLAIESVQRLRPNPPAPTAPYGRGSGEASSTPIAQRGPR